MGRGMAQGNKIMKAVLEYHDASPTLLNIHCDITHTYERDNLQQEAAFIILMKVVRSHRPPG